MICIVIATQILSREIRGLVKVQLYELRVFKAVGLTSLLRQPYKILITHKYV